METKQIQKIAKQAVQRSREHAGKKVWAFVNRGTRKGMVARFVVADFGAYSPDATAKDVAAVVKACDEIVDGEKVSA